MSRSYRSCRKMLCPGICGFWPLLLCSAAYGHPLKGAETAVFRVFRNYVECTLHGPFADLSGAVSAADLKEERTEKKVLDAISKWMKSGLFEVSPDGKSIVPEITSATYYKGQTANGDSFQIDLKYPVKSGAKTLVVTASFNPETILSINGTSRRMEMGTGPVTLQTGFDLSNVWRNVMDFAHMGIDHLVTGIDHMLFICTLIFAATGFKQVVKLLTAFTLGHAITLVLTTFDLFRVNPHLVDIGVAGTIVYVALENIFREKEAAHRWLVVFFFGLIHGMGFSEALREMGLPDKGLVLCLLSFNVGIELAQVGLVALIYPLLGRIRWFKEHRRPETGKLEYQQVLKYANGLTAALGGYWLVSRVFLS